MQSSTVKYGGAFLAIIGLIITVVFGSIYGWSQRSGWTNFDVFDYSIVWITGAILLVGGLLAFIFIEE